MISIGSEVHLKGAPHGQPGRVIRIERSRIVVLWQDLDFIGRHEPASLVEAEDMSTHASL